MGVLMGLGTIARQLAHKSARTAFSTYDYGATKLLEVTLEPPLKVYGAFRDAREVGNSIPGSVVCVGLRAVGRVRERLIPNYGLGDPHYKAAPKE